MVSLARLLGKLMMLMASNGHFYTHLVGNKILSKITNTIPALVHIPHPMHRVSEIVAILSVGTTSMQSFPAQ